MASQCWVFTFTVLWVSNTFWESFLREGIFNTKIISTNLLRHIEMILDHVIDLHVVDFRHLRTLRTMHQIDWIWNPSHKLKILLLKFSQDFYAWLSRFVKLVCRNKQECSKEVLWNKDKFSAAVIRAIRLKTCWWQF